MKMLLKLIVAIVFAGLLTWLIFDFRISRTTSLISPIPDQQEVGPEIKTENDVANPLIPTSNQYPLDRAAERVTKKPFDLFVTPQNSPVSPERFRGYHAGTDFEVFPEELNADVSVRAICSGRIIYRSYVSGYGGVAIESCEIDKQPVTVLYGHLRLNSIQKSIGDPVSQGDELGVLGREYSVETDGERKHLHLSIHNGKGVVLLGYVQTQAALKDWIDPCPLVCGK